jgi:hypothetical protein
MGLFARKIFISAAFFESGFSSVLAGLPSVWLAELALRVFSDNAFMIMICLVTL